MQYWLLNSWLILALCIPLKAQSLPDTIFLSALDDGQPCWGLCVYATDTIAFETLGGSPHIPGHNPWNNTYSSRAFLVRDHNQAYSGNYSIGLNYLSSTTHPSSAALKFECPLSSGQEYQVSFWLKGDFDNIQLQYMDSSTRTRELTLTETTNTVGNWQQVNCTFTPNTQITHLVWNYTRNSKKKHKTSAANRIFLDDILITSREKFECPLNIPLADTTIILKEVLFTFNSDSLTPAAHKFLQDWVNHIKQLNYQQFIITGHTDNTGDEAYNIRLSEKRAIAVAHFFIKNGIDTNKIITIGSGSSQPLAPNITPENQAANRRVEIRIIY